MGFLPEYETLKIRKTSNFRRMKFILYQYFNPLKIMDTTSNLCHNVGFCTDFQEYKKATPVSITGFLQQRVKQIDIVQI